MKPKPTHADVAGSRYLALQRLARAQNRATAELLQLYVLESFLRRLSRSHYDERFVLKGGMLLAAFALRRATRDVDLLALRTDNDLAVVERLIVEIASVDVHDGVTFLLDTLTAGPIRGDDVYPGVRAVLEARLATARIKFSIDINVGDPVVPAPIRTAVPVLLGDERIEVLAYPKAMVVAEKLVTALQRGRASTRWRDFADLFVLVSGDLLEAEVIGALRAVAAHRSVSLQPLGEVLAGMPKEAQAWGNKACPQGAILKRIATFWPALATAESIVSCPAPSTSSSSLPADGSTGISKGPSHAFGSRMRCSESSLPSPGTSLASLNDSDDGSLVPRKTCLEGSC